MCLVRDQGRDDPAAAAPPPSTGLHAHPAATPGIPFPGDPPARLQTLLPDHPSADMAVNLFTYDPGATLPFGEILVIEHGRLFLDSGGVYRLGDDWHPVTRPRCPLDRALRPAVVHWRRPRTRPLHFYYKDINRSPA